LPPVPGTDHPAEFAGTAEAYEASVRDLVDQLARARHDVAAQAEKYELKERQAEIKRQDAIDQKKRENQARNALLSQFHVQWLKDNPKPPLWPKDLDYLPENLNAYRNAEAERSSGSRLGPHHEGPGEFDLRMGQRPAPKAHVNFFNESLATGARHDEEIRRNDAFARGGFKTSTPRLPTEQFNDAEEGDVADFLSSSSGEEGPGLGPVAEERPTDPVDRMTEALTSLLKCNLAGKPSGYTARNPPWSFAKLNTGPNGECKALTYHHWKRSVKQNIVKLKIDEEAALMALQQDNKVLHRSVQALIVHCDNLEQVWRRLDENYPHIETTETELIESVICRPECPNDPRLQILHCDALMSAIENKCRVHPHHFLNRTQAMATLGAFKDIDVTNAMIRVDEDAAKGIPYEKALYDHCVRFRRSKMDIQNALESVGRGKDKVERSSHLSMNAKQEGRGRGGRDPKTPKSDSSRGPKDGPKPKKDLKDLFCALCEGHGHYPFRCSKLPDVKRGKVPLPKAWCRRCLRTKERDAPHLADCHVLTTSKGPMSFICVIHKEAPTHKFICRQGDCAESVDRTPHNHVVVKNEK
jgi:hypothetical protein